MLKIVGAKGNIKDVEDFLDKVFHLAEKKGIETQVFDADMIFGKNHLVSAVEHAKRAMERGNESCDSLSMEILLYASGVRQIKQAIPKMGVKRGQSNIAFVFLKKGKISSGFIDNFLTDMSLVRNDKVLEGNVDTLKHFGINKNMIETVKKDKYGDLILEKVAMVDIIK